MGRRSRQAATTRAQRDAARRRPRPRPGRPSIDDRPPAPWGSLPLTELVILRFIAGLALASLGGVELAVREHLAGYRSHSSLIAGVAAFAVVTGLALGPGPHRVWILVLIAAVVFGGAFYGLRELFKRRSGGLGFR